MSLDEEREWTLQEFQEFRFEVESKDLLTVKVISGKAELFGTELANQVEYQFKGKKLAIFTWHGCVLKTKGKNVVEYIGYETPMQSHINLHFALEELRELSKQLDKVGPRVMLLGPADVGKTSLAKTLIGYATRSGSSPILVDLDPDQGLVSLPGTLSAFAIHRPIDAEEEFSASLSLYKTSPICYYYGSADVEDQINLYASVMERLSVSVRTKLNDNLVKYSGIIVDSSSQFVSNPEVLEKAIGYFDSNLHFNTVNVLIVIGHERLLSDLQRKYTDNDQMKILKLAKSGGVVTRDRAAKRQMHLQRVKEYFYGTVGNDLTPFSQTVSFSDIIVRRAVEGSIAPSSALPIGMEVNSQEIKFVKVDAGDILLHSILAVSFAPLPGSEARLDIQGNPKIYTPEEEAQVLLSCNISGFIYISEVDEKKRKMTILCPNPGRLPKCYLIMGSLKWMDA